MSQDLPAKEKAAPRYEVKSICCRNHAPIGDAELASWLNAGWEIISMLSHDDIMYAFLKRQIEPAKPTEL